LLLGGRRERGRLFRFLGRWKRVKPQMNVKDADGRGGNAKEEIDF